MQLPLHYTYCLETNTTRKSICRAQKEPNMKNVMINLFQITADHLNDIDPYHIIETRIELRFLIIYDFFVKTPNLSRRKACPYLTIMKSHDQAELTVA